ncbi:hypothetical protein, partial [Streptomyces katrae]
MSLYLSSGAAAGKVRVQVRAVREDPGSAVADAVVDLASLGGPGAGWVEVPLSAFVSPGSRYWLFAQATTAGDQPVVWYGTRGDTAGGPEGARYD